MIDHCSTCKQERSSCPALLLSPKEVWRQSRNPEARQMLCDYTVQKANNNEVSKLD